MDPNGRNVILVDKVVVLSGRVFTNIVQQELRYALRETIPWNNIADTVQVGVPSALENIMEMQYNVKLNKEIKNYFLRFFFSSKVLFW